MPLAAQPGWIDGSMDASHLDRWIDGCTSSPDLMVVLCADKDVNPVINTGTLNQ
jgi:hypothetical protein